jgi:two-component system response regulator (stage 0 sporulation protein F)
MARILIVDDQPEVLRGLCRILEEEGHTVSEAENGVVALRQCASESFDLVITDMFMPEVDGIELFLELKRSSPEVGVIAMSGGGSLFPRDQILQYADVLGADSLLEKPFSREGVVEAVNRLVTPADERVPVPWEPENPIIQGGE